MSYIQQESVGLGFTFSGLMPLVIDMTLTGPLNLGPETPTLEEETVGNRARDTLINLTLSTFSLSLRELCMEPTEYNPDSRGYPERPQIISIVGNGHIIQESISLSQCHWVSFAWHEAY